MKERSHAKILRQIQRSADGRLTSSQQQALDTHLSDCAECRSYADEIRTIETRLSSVSHTRLVPPNTRATAQQIAAIQTSYRRHIMKKQIFSLAGALVTIAAVAIFIILLNRIVPAQPSPAAAPSTTVTSEMPTTTIAVSTPTPQNQPLRYFTRAESDSLPLLPWQLTPQPETPTPNPGWTFNLSIEDAQKRAGFNVLVPGWLPETVYFEGASYQPDHNIVRIFYRRRGDPAEEYGFVLREERFQTSDDCDDLCGVVGLGAWVDTVQIGDFPGEYAVGAWIFTDNGPLWENTTLHKALRWQANGMAYELTYGGGPDDVTEDDVIALAESIPYTALAITEAEDQFGYALKTLASLPAGYVFSRVDVHQPSSSVCLVYEYTGNDGPGPELWLAQGPIANAPGLVTQQGFADAQQTPVGVRGADEAYSLYGMQRNGEWACVPSQSGSNPALRLTWQADGQQFDLYATSGKCLGEEGLSDLDLLRLAEGMTGLASHAADELDQECTRDIGAVEGLAGFMARFPQGKPGGMVLYGASYGGAPGRQIGLYYMLLPGNNHTGLWIHQMPVNPELGNDLASQYRDLPAQGYQLLTIAGDPAVMILGDWVINDQGEKVWYQEPGFAPTLWFESDGLLIAISGPWLVEAGGNPQEKLVAVAESIAYSDLTIAEVKALVRFDVLEPANLPANFSFSRAAYNPEYNLVLLTYFAGSGEDLTGLTVKQQPAPNGVDCELCGFVVGDSAATDAAYPGKVVGANATIETVQIGDATGEYVEGGWQGTDCCGWVWEPTPARRELRWQANGMAFELTYGASHYPDDVTIADLIAIAESLR